LPAVLETVAVPVHFEDVYMVSEAIEERSGKPFRAKTSVHSSKGNLIWGPKELRADRLLCRWWRDNADPWYGVPHVIL
jgi:hypothetical protein